MTNNTVIVIGAGTAGLSAARALHDAGIEVIVLEARDRIGGRIWSNDALGGYVDMGASWIHGVKKNPIQKLAKKNKIKTIPTDWDSYLLYSADGEEVPDRQVVKAESRFRKLMKQLDKHREELDKDIALRDGIDALLAKRDLSAEESCLIEWVMIGEIEHDYAANLSDMSLWWWDQDEELKGDHVVFPKGYRQIIDILAKGLDIRLNTVVEEVEYKGGVTVKTADGDAIKGTHVIVAVPLGVLKHKKIQFSPTLPASKQQAIHNLEMGAFHKTYLRFPEVFWDDEYEFFGYVAEAKDQWITWMNYQYYIDEPVLMSINTGQFAHDLEKMSDAHVIDRAMAVLRTIYGESIPDPTDYLLTSWMNDPFSMGAYSYIPIGASGDDYKAMAQPVADRLFFAGEATTREYPSTVHGAFLSGQREAERIRKLLK